ncbi:MAG TPA: hypothetical protein VF581_01995 [Flavobacterium sp.]|jgi:hypothetical protein
MKKLILLLLFLFSCTLISYGQKVTIDENVSVHFPGIPNKSNDKLKGFEVNSFYLNTTDSFVILRTAGVDQSLPLLDNKIELQNFYRRFSETFIKSCNQKGLITNSANFITKGKYLGYQIEFVDKESKVKNGEALVMFADGIAYIFVYSKIETFSSERSESFLKSINFKDDLSQLKSESIFGSSLTKLFLLIGVIIALLYIMQNRKSKTAVNT